MTYQKINYEPKNVRWDIPPQNQGQIIEVAYADVAPMSHEAITGAMFRRVLDRGDNTVEYYRLQSE